jgi:transcriptional regulator with XRE-family HTH domain
MTRKKSLAFGPVLRTLRYDRNLTQDELSERVGIASAYISMLESSRKFPSLEMIFRLAGGLGIPASSILAAMEERLLIKIK